MKAEVTSVSLVSFFHPSLRQGQSPTSLSKVLSSSVLENLRRSHALISVKLLIDKSDFILNCNNEPNRDKALYLELRSLLYGSYLCTLI